MGIAGVGVTGVVGGGVEEGAAAKVMIFSAFPSPADPSDVERDESVTWPPSASVVLVVWV